MKHSKEERELYYCSLGKFVDAFSTVEDLVRELYLVAMRYAHKEPKDHLMTPLSIIVKETGELFKDNDTLCQRDFNHFFDLMRIRNSIFHHRSSIIEGNLVSTNRHFEIKPDKVKTFRSDPLTLELITMDLTIIQSSFAYRFYCVTLGEGSIDGRSLIEATRSFALTPWHYAVKHSEDLPV
ncbi:hypothetical protein ACI01nite_26340 [Acetobacter cibinongensis]|uniref:Uncharacterized protein n=1 Tax=Acetobacter cibinongensis TaxID=146475 RepID=A0A0D6N3N0_9PROT|nr:hypothetical protein [Acetobacter cibinongensis]GAN60126.1 hypothetical protein Abci_009_031 [Acetobacter cibinongensis]GBQ11742.1 hypothetical protein AA0482_0029 [Acetobacter cibinongensis NRIC 0482]GEL60032.1 hypothetical protein ACI01nite_26340 [Acetobacter cibinongensis]